MDFQVLAILRIRNPTCLAHARYSNLNCRAPQKYHASCSNMASYEPHRSSAYSEDMRWRIIWQKYTLGYTFATIATNLNVDLSTIRRVLDTFSATGTVAKVYPTENAFRKITEPVKFFIVHLILEKPGIYLREITAEVRSTLGVELTESAVCKFLSKTGFTRQ